MGYDNAFPRSAIIDLSVAPRASTTAAPAPTEYPNGAALAVINGRLAALRATAPRPAADSMTATTARSEGTPDG